MANISISQMNTRAEANLSDLHEVAYADSNSQTGYASGKMTMEVMANAIVNGFTYQSLGNKKISKAIEDAEVTVDTALDPTSTNAVQNKAIAHELAGGNTQASGDVVTITDGSNLALTSATSTLAPIQDLHGYSSPWVGGAGKNLVESKISGYYLTAQGTLSPNPNYDVQLAKIKEGVTYTVTTDATELVCGFYTSLPTSESVTYDNSRIVQAGYTFTAPIDGYAGFRSTSTDTTPQLEQGNQATSYAPYSNICPISGYDSAEYTRTGVNVWDEEWENGELNASGQNTPSAIKIRSKNYIAILPSKDYYRYIGFEVPSYICFYDDNKNFITSETVNTNRTFSTPNNAYYMRFNLPSLYGTTYNHDICINISNPLYNGNYYPYQGQAVTLTFENTIYSGVIDWISGVVTVDMAMVDLGTLTWEKIESAIVDEYRFYSDDLRAYIMEILSTTTVANILCSHFKTNNFNNVNNGAEGIYEHPNKSVGIHCKQYNSYTSEQFKTAMDGVQLCYELATPTTIQLTPTQLKTLAGYNTIYTDVGNISIAYQPNNVIAECKEYTDNAIPTVDSELDDTSLNPIANKPVAEAIADIVGDISDIDSNIEGSKQLTTTGNVITVSDSAATYLEELEVEVEPVQDLSNGDPSPTNICPITGYDEVSVQTTDEEETTTNTITATFDNTVYSGHVDFTSGVVTVDKGYIASYNGETLTGAWISDRDVYTSGGTPTTGAEVVYELATPQTIQLTPQQLQMLKGYNTVITDANGGMTIKYQPDNVVGEIKAYASRLYDDILDRLEALSE